MGERVGGSGGVMIYPKTHLHFQKIFSNSGRHFKRLIFKELLFTERKT